MFVDKVYIVIVTTTKKYQKLNYYKENNSRRAIFNALDKEKNIPKKKCL